MVRTGKVGTLLKVVEKGREGMEGREQIKGCWESAGKGMLGKCRERNAGIVQGNGCW